MSITHGTSRAVADAALGTTKAVTDAANEIKVQLTTSVGESLDKTKDLLSVNTAKTFGDAMVDSALDHGVVAGTALGAGKAASDFTRGAVVVVDGLLGGTGTAMAGAAWGTSKAVTSAALATDVGQAAGRAGSAAMKSGVGKAFSDRASSLGSALGIGKTNETGETTKFRVVATAKLKRFAALESEVVGKLRIGTVVDTIDSCEINGIKRLHIRGGGWTSVRAQSGNLLLIPAGIAFVETPKEVEEMPPVYHTRRARPHAPDGLETAALTGTVLNLWVARMDAPYHLRMEGSPKAGVVQAGTVVEAIHHKRDSRGREKIAFSLPTARVGDLHCWAPVKTPVGDAYFSERQGTVIAEVQAQVHRENADKASRAKNAMLRQEPAERALAEAEVSAVTASDAARPMATNDSRATWKSAGRRPAGRPPAPSAKESTTATSTAGCRAAKEVWEPRSGDGGSHEVAPAAASKRSGANAKKKKKRAATQKKKKKQHPEEPLLGQCGTAVLVCGSLSVAALVVLGLNRPS
jgi:hypothetical protein